MNDVSNEIAGQVAKFEEVLKTYSNLHRADPNLLHSIKVSTPHGITTLKSIASIVATTDSSRGLRVTPFDSNNLKIIAKVLWDAELGNVTETKNEVLLALHPVTQEYKNRIFKEVKETAEKHKIIIRKKRQDFLNDIKKLANENEKKLQEKKIQKIIDDNMSKIDSLLNGFMRV
jgi:ribosome recycling factor